MHGETLKISTEKEKKTVLPSRPRSYMNNKARISIYPAACAVVQL